MTKKYRRQEKKTHFKGFSATKKVGVVLLVTLFLMSFVLAAATLFEFFNPGDDAETTVAAAEQASQTFTIGTVGADVNFQIENVTLRIHKQNNPPNDMVVNIYNVNASGDPEVSGQPLSTGTITAAEISGVSPGDLENISMSPVTLGASTKYAIVMNTSAGDGTNRYRPRFNSTSDYTGGDFYSSADNGVKWTKNAARDFVFKIWGTQDFFQNVTLINPANAQKFSTGFIDNINFTFNSTTTVDNLVNSTLFVWNSTNDIVNQTTVSISGTTEISELLVTNIQTTDSYKWNALRCTDDNSCVFATTNRTFTIASLTLDQCNSTLTTVFLNITFKNETISQEDVTATIDSSITFWGEDATINSTVTLLNATENPSYAFCSDTNESINTFTTINYNNADSQQRTSTVTRILTNVTTSEVLYLLPTGLGLFTQFQTRDVANNPIDLVKGTISRTIGGSSIVMFSGLTDTSGVLVAFLNPDATYSATFSKTGFVDNSFSFVPITDLRFVTMGTVGGEVNGSEIALNTTYTITPTNGSLVNNTNVTFGFNVVSAQTVTLITMNITNSSGSQIGFNSTAGQGSITIFSNIGNNTRISGRFTIKTSDETFTITKTWIIGNEFEGDYSLFKQLELFLDYEFGDFIRLLMVILILTGLMIYMSGGDIIENSESKIIVALLVIWGFSLVGWLSTPIVASSTGIAQFGKQFGIAIISTAFGMVFILRRLIIRRI